MIKMHVAVFAQLCGVIGHYCACLGGLVEFA